MRLGDHLSYNGVSYVDTVLPEGLLSDWLPWVFRNIGWPDFYHIGLVYPLAALACFGLAALVRERSQRTRALVCLAACFVVAIEFYAPQAGNTIKPERTAYIDFMRTEPESAIKVINLPQEWWHRQSYLFTQAVSGWPMAYGFQHRLLPILEAQISRNHLLENLVRQSQSALPAPQRASLHRRIGAAAGGRLHACRLPRLENPRPPGISFLAPSARRLRRWLRGGLSPARHAPKLPARARLAAAQPFCAVAAGAARSALVNSQLSFQRRPRPQ